MAVPARPVDGQPIDPAWGQVAHDTAVAQDIQAGTANVPANAGSVAVVFARPFAAPPSVTVTMAANSRGYTAGIAPPTTGGVTILASTTGSAPGSPTVALNISWIAVGPRL
jgi:hypothetical protein